MWETNVSHSITAIAGGFVTSNVHEEYVLHTYAGFVMALTSGTHHVKRIGSAPGGGPEGEGLSQRDRLLQEVQAAEQRLQQAASQAQVRSNGTLGPLAACEHESQLHWRFQCNLQLLTMYSPMIKQTNVGRIGVSGASSRKLTEEVPAGQAEAAEVQSWQAHAAAGGIAAGEALCPDAACRRDLGAQH